MIESPIAIDIALLPRDSQVSALNHAIHTSFPGGFRFDRDHRAHVTLLQDFFRPSDLPRIWEIVRELWHDQIPSLEVTALECHATYMDNLVLPTLALRDAHGSVRTLQAAILTQTAEFSCEPVVDGAFAEPVDAPCHRFVSEYRAKTAQEFTPHITLGVCPRESLDGLSMDAYPSQVEITGLALAQLGNVCTLSREHLRETSSRE